MDALCRCVGLGLIHAFVEPYRIGGNRLFCSIVLRRRFFRTVRRFVADSRNRIFNTRLDSPCARRRHVPNHAGFCARRSGYSNAHRFYNPQCSGRYRFGYRNRFIFCPYRFRFYKDCKKPQDKTAKLKPALCASVPFYTRGSNKNGTVYDYFAVNLVINPKLCYIKIITTKDEVNP